MGEQDYRQVESQGMAPDARPFVSVCIPARNSESNIGYTIENLLNQRYPRERFEIIIANHASTDNTAGIVNRYIPGHNIKLIDASDGSRSRAYVRNRCLEAARGGIIIFIDADILVCDTFIEAHLRARELCPDSLVAGYVYGKMQVFGADDATGQGFLTSSITDRHKALQSSPMYKDSREFFACIDRGGADYQVVTGKPDAWRISWSCNLSARRQDMLDVGGFDENFTGWGLEDEEFGYRFMQSGRGLVFAQRAWGYHVPHPANARRNYADFKRNLGRFFNKHQTADIELLHINFFPSTVMRVLGPSFNFFPNNEEYKNLIRRSSAKLGKPEGSRLGVFSRQETDAAELGLTHCLIPGLPWHTAPYQKELAGESRRFYSLLGLHTGFADGEINETVIPVDILMFLNESLLSGILLETVRISRKIILICGEIANNPGHAETRRVFDRLLSLMKAGQITVLNV